MWRSRSVTAGRDSESLEVALRRTRLDRDALARADATMQAAAASEPLIEQSLQTPQSLPHHGEGPFLSFHLHDILTTLNAIQDGTLRLMDVEEFRRLRGYEGEVEELQETLRERASFFEVFALCHDAAKWVSVTCDALPESRGEALGFRSNVSVAWEDIGVAERAAMRTKYLDLYTDFAAQRPGVSPQEVQLAFSRAYGISVHYPGHDRMIHAPVYRGLLGRMCAARRLSDDDANLLEHLIAHHMQPLSDFSQARPERIGRLIALANDRGYDGDDFIDLLQGCVFLDMVAGSAFSDQKSLRHDATPLINFFEAEHAFAPWKRAEGEKRRLEKQKHQRNLLYRTVGLDGIALMDLLVMEAGPVFGKMLAAIHAAIEGKGELPAFPPKIAKELAHRIETYYEKAFGAGA